MAAARVDPLLFMRQHLQPVVQESLRDENNLVPVFSNVVSNLKLDARDANGPVLLPILDILNQHIGPELKQGFGALIFRFMHTLSRDQERAEHLKDASVTHLCFAKGALGSTGNRSREEAIRSVHEFRMFLYYNYHIRTNTRRFTIPNMVCSSGLGHSVNLAQMHAEDQVNTDYYPDLFPGLFFYYKYVFKNREGIHANLVKLSEDDLVQLHRHSNSSSRNESDDVVREHVRGMLDSFLPKYKFVMVLVFIGGKLVGLGVDDQEAAEEAFKHVGAVAARYKITEREANEFKKRRKAQDRMVDKEEHMDEIRINYTQPFSKSTLKKLDQLSIEDEAQRREQFRKILLEERENKKKSKRTPGQAPRKKAKGAADEPGLEDLVQEEYVEQDEIDGILDDLLQENGGLEESGYASDSSGANPTTPTSHHSTPSEVSGPEASAGAAAGAEDPESVLNSLLSAVEGHRDSDDIASMFQNPYVHGPVPDSPPVL